MRLKAIPLVFLGVLSILTAELWAETPGESSADRFLNVYQLNQKGETQESNKDYAGALRTLKEALGILDDIAGKDPKWNTQIVEFRRKRIVDAMARLETKAGASGPTNGTIPGIPEQGQVSGGVSELPDLVDPPLPKPDKPKTGPSRNAKPPSGTLAEQIDQQMAELKEKARVAQEERDAALRSSKDLQSKLDKSNADRANSDKQLKLLTQRSDVAEKALLEERSKKAASAEQLLTLQTQAAKYKTAIKSLTEEREAAEEVRVQESTRHTAVLKRANDAALASDNFKKALDDLDKKHKGEMAAVQKELSTTKAQVTDLEVKLTEVTSQRDTYKSQVDKLQQNKKDLDKALADNATLMTKLSDAEKQITQFKADSAQKDVLITDLKKEIVNVNKQLDDAKKDSASYQKKMSELQTNLQATSEKLALANTTASAGAAEKKKLTEENDILRGIATRQLKQQAGRDQTRKLILAELAKMEVKSKDLLMRIDLLAGPVVKLTPKEAALFKKPEVQVGDNEIALAAPKQEAPEAAPELPKPDETPALVSITPAAPISLAPATPAPLTPPVPIATPARTIAVAKAPATPTKAATPTVAVATPVKTATPAVAMATPVKAATPTVAVATPAKAAPPALPSKSDPPELAMLDMSRLNKPSGLDTARTPAPTTPATAPSPGASEPRTEPATGGNVIETGAGVASVPADLQPVAASAKDNFERGNYGAAEKLYETILAKAPTNLYALSNLGVVRFREGKLKLAEESFRKAIAIAPEDAFSRCTLGIIYYSQSRYDEAVNELTKSLAINPKYAAAHNFLGITASQKGWQEAAQKELETATSLDPNYADAHFNLAVVYATQQPANKENARKFYQRATELGAEKDPSLEALLK